MKMRLAFAVGLVAGFSTCKEADSQFVPTCTRRALPEEHQSGTFLVMTRALASASIRQSGQVGRTIRFPGVLRNKIAADAERCGRSFEAQVVALLRRHYGEDVDIAPRPETILALATASLADIQGSDLRTLTTKLTEAGR
jgi:hypothetical protein